MKFSLKGFFVEFWGDILNLGSYSSPKETVQCINVAGTTFNSSKFQLSFKFSLKIFYRTKKNYL